MAVTVARKHKEERGVLMRDLQQEWRQLRKAAQAHRFDAVLWRLGRVRQAKGMHQLTLAELLVGSGSVS